MAFGARELRLILSIQSYGTGNIQRLRRDLLNLDRATQSANANQLRVARQIEQQSQKAFQARRRMHALERQTMQQPLRVINARSKALKDLEKLGFRGVVAQQALAKGMMSTNKHANAIAQNYKAIEMAEKAVVSDLARQKTLYNSLSASVRKLITEEQFRAMVLDKQIAKMNTLQQKEVRLRTAAHVGRTLQFGGLIGLAGLSGAANSFANFNKQVTLAATQARGVNRPLSDIPVLAQAISKGIHNASTDIDGIIDLMQQFPATGDEMAQASYDIFSSMTVSFGGGMKLLKQFNQLAVATGSDLATAVDAGITVLNNFGDSQGTVIERMNLMTTIIRFGRMRLADLNAMLEKVAPAATAAGQSLEDVSGAMVAITRLQPSQRVGATGIARLLQTFRDPDFQRGAAKFGIDMTTGAEAVGKLKPLPDIIKSFATGPGLFTKFGGPQQLFKELTAVGRGSGIGRQSRIEAANAFTFLVGHWKQYRALQKAATGDTREFEVALKAMSDAPGVKWEVFINQMRALILTIGEAALPALLSLADILVKGANWFQGLSDGTQEAIVKFIAFGSAAALISGTFGNMVASIGAAIISLKVYRLSAAMAAGESVQAAAKVGMLSIALRSIAGIGLISIPIVVQLLKGGDPGMWDLLGAAGMGAAGGAMIGSAFAPGLGTLVGAGVGAIAVPITIELISKFQKGDPKGPQSAAQKAYDEYRQAIFDRINANKGVKEAPMSFEEFLKINPALAEKHKQFLKKNTKDSSSIMDQYTKNVRAMNKEMVQNWIDEGKRINDAWRQQDQNLNEHQKRQQQIQKIRINATQAAEEAVEQAVKTGTDNLISLYEELEDANKQAFGSFAQGPVMQGMLGQIFGNINDLVRQFGVQIPIPFELLKRDLDLQMAYFKRWIAAITKLRKAGLPQPLLEQIQAMGPTQGIPIAEGLLSGGKKGIKGIVKQWEDAFGKGGDIDRATQADFDAKLKYWRSFGNDAAYQMVMGIISNPRNAELQKKFRDYIKTNFASQLGEVFSEAFSESFSQGIADMQAAAAAAVASIPKFVVPKTGAAGGAKPLTLAQQAAVRQGQIELRRALRSATSPTGPSGVVIDLPERRRLDQFRQQIRRARTSPEQARAMMLSSIRGQVARQERRAPFAPTYTITYGGDTIRVSSVMSPKEIQRFFERRAWNKRNKSKRGKKGN